jgi:hypothetical protein
MKTKGPFSRYPRKISVLKDLLERISPLFSYCKPMKTGSELEVPSKISLLKDLADAFLESWGPGIGTGYEWTMSKLSKSEKSLLLSNS